ncbi:MAG: ABC transporter ATPase [Bacteroidia bacterium]
MNTTINNMPAEAKVWVYQSNKPFTDEQLKLIATLGADFIQQWMAHGDELKASFDIINKQFIVIAVDEKQAMASGCSIDKSIELLKKIDQLFNLSLFDRLQVAYRTSTGIEVCSLAVFEKRLQEKLINSTTIVFNNMVSTKQEFETQWELPLNQSWHKRYLV